ncbi:hypothetical protein EVAR_64870_1 [Eumeta japonica]|uniref:Uncharacterized protein n=1 Tax=Eumeta variegata TaxID=151549 RepID=A0A4C1ZHT2_EUMVA|nr:hypothetical protein EVAR_64870_1 [Eumeta japonica]
MWNAPHVQYNARNSAAVKLVTKASQWHKIGRRGRRRMDRGALHLRIASFAGNAEPRVSWIVLDTVESDNGKPSNDTKGFSNNRGIAQKCLSSEEHLSGFFRGFDKRELSTAGGAYSAHAPCYFWAS